jgi:hypothetical protein
LDTKLLLAAHFIFDMVQLPLLIARRDRGSHSQTAHFDDQRSQARVRKIALKPDKLSIVGNHVLERSFELAVFDKPVRIHVKVVKDVPLEVFTRGVWESAPAQIVVEQRSKLSKVAL